ncbi:small nuclear RNA activating complex (SNAPc), subunit SNAP43 domain-containing protein [Ditylenchus destructor]|uniref:Small nuclear RNA activating complex (SNAPc), subunit SNAP43 domain-containing protein n=1 Tax=Ditylenchus destructor TaxID=166010 RepID=A0AAD4QTL0_9BILA|nr:small nuclear RNA activating complex (SNAPc), subunit SNAP43 domain-containing protein [Ditylenchus destructor]
MPIRMSTTQMESLHKYLAEVLLPEEQYEAMFCIFRLVRGNAFAVTPFETEYNPILYRRFDPAGSDPNMIEKDLQNIESGDDFTFLKELNSDTLISQIDSVHNAYMKAKAQRGLLDTNNKKLGLNLVKGNLCNFVANLLNETKKALEEQRQLKVRLPTTNSSQESDTNRRSKIRSDAYSQGLVHQRHRRHRMGHVDRNSESQDLVSPVKQEIRPSTSENPTTSSSPAKRRKSATSPEKRPKTRRPAAASSKSPTSKVRTGHTEVEADESDDAMKKKLNKLQAELLRMSSD